ncbi:MAG: hypothetical protein QOH76_2823 [Thermoleophilaceae bacterium]|nr:hypothetical protein [Thermoleophilaceae bacterium]
MRSSRPRFEIVFLLAGCEARRAELRQHARSALQRADFRALERNLAGRRLLPLIGSRAIEAAPDLIPDSFREAVASARATARARGLAIEVTTARLASALADMGIPALPLKGPLLAAEAHGDLGLRETSDIDLLVPTSRLDDAARVLCAAGYSEPTDVRRPNGLPDLHLELRHESLPSVDLHWRVHWNEHAFSERMLAGARPGTDGLLHARPKDRVASILLFHARDGMHGVRAATDLAAWWDRHGAALPPRFLEGHASSHPELAPPLTAAAISAERLTGVPAVGWLGRSASSGRRVDVAVRLADWEQAADRDQMSANVMLVGALLGPRGSGREFVRRELVLPRRSRAASAIHTAKVGVRAAIALWKVRGSRMWAKPPADGLRGGIA